MLSTSPEFTSSLPSLGVEWEGTSDRPAADLGESAPLKLCALDADLRFESLNRVWRHQIGSPALGSSFLDALAEEDRASAGEVLRGLCERGGTRTLEARLDLVSELRWHRFDFNAVVDAGARPRLVGVATDIALEQARTANVNARLRQMALQILVMRRLLNRRSGDRRAVVHALAVIGEMADGQCVALATLRAGLLAVSAEWSEEPSVSLAPPLNGQRPFALFPFSAPEIQAATLGIPLRPAELRRFPTWSAGAMVAFPIQGESRLAGLLLVAQSQVTPHWTSSCLREIGNLGQVFLRACEEELNP